MANIFKKLDVNSASTLAFRRETPISLVTAEAFERLKLNKERRAAREAERVKKQGAKLEIEAPKEATQKLEPVIAKTAAPAEEQPAPAKEIEKADVVVVNDLSKRQKNVGVSGLAIIVGINNDFYVSTDPVPLVYPNEEPSHRTSHNRARERTEASVPAVREINSEPRAEKLPQNDNSALSGQNGTPASAKKPVQSAQPVSSSMPTSTSVLPEAVTPEKPIAESQSSKEETSMLARNLITLKRSMWDVVKGFHESKTVDECAVLHRDRLVGVMLYGETALDVEFPECLKTLSDSEAKWGKVFARNYACEKSLLVNAGNFPLHGREMFYATLGYIEANKKMFAKLLSPELMAELERTRKENHEELVMSYIHANNNLSLTAFSGRRSSVIQAINGVKDSFHVEDSFKVSQPIALLHSNKLKAVALPESFVVPRDFVVSEVGVADFAEKWSEIRNDFPSNVVVRVKAKSHHMYLISPSAAPELLREVERFCPPDINTMVQTVYKAKDDELIPNRERHYASVDKVVQKVETAPPPTPVVAAKVAPVQAPVPVAAAPKPAPQAPKAQEQESAMERDITQQIIMVAQALQELRAAEGKLSHKVIEKDRIIGFGPQMAERFTQKALTSYVSLYEGFKDANEPNVTHEWVEFKGSIAEKAGILRDAFAKTDKDKNHMVILKDGDYGVVIGRNASFNNLVLEFKV